MRYIRYLKTPKTDGGKLTALVTITSDLGEDLLADEVALSATVRSADPYGDIYLRKSLKWTGGMRSLPVTFDLTPSNVEWPVRLHVGFQTGEYTDRFERRHASGHLPSLVSAWSDVIDPDNGITEAAKRVERRFMPLSNRTLSIWEETGESIARHLWWETEVFLSRRTLLTPLQGCWCGTRSLPRPYGSLASRSHPSPRAGAKLSNIQEAQRD